jgi:putative O-methyltransferase
MNITNDKVTDYINSYYKALDEELLELRIRSENARIPIILRETETVLRSILLLKKPQRILEIGTANGYSASFFAKLLPTAHITTIEASQERYEEAVQNFKNLGLDNNVTVHFGMAEDLLVKMEHTRENNFDFVFIDAAKSKYLEFFNAAIKLCNTNAIVISDNVLMRAMVASDEFDEKRRYKTNIKHLRAYVDYLFQQKNHYTSILSVGDGLALTELDVNN